ncbi:hypothetical protein WR25_02410 isoform D [Diploscapter pachys]|uniref:Uncharacterized protein n=1 Tax=Diploscapter pachys TaxID=2018661 RepID=A0A2A2JNR3_9BILA|nr:hypothetical protein WR25_02410 isoform C [Diploscapter pachys]PAV63298.1 hypothetical protein WR25_02410 isoform D [Diploscapter pachys]
MVFPINLPQLVPSSTARTARYVQQQNEAQLHRQPPDPLTPLVMAPPLVVQHIAQNLHTEMQFGLSPATTGGFFASVSSFFPSPSFSAPYHSSPCINIATRKPSAIASRF